MISKKEALEALDNEIKSMEKCKLPQIKAGLIQAREVINNLQPVVYGEWIPVSKRLPEEEYDTVLVVTDIKHYCVAVYTTEHGFRTGDIDAEGEIVAWIPLIEYKPEPPELIVPMDMLTEALLRTFLGRTE